MNGVGDDGDLMSLRLGISWWRPFGREGDGAPRVEFAVRDEEVLSYEVPAFESAVEFAGSFREAVLGVGSVGEWEVVGALAFKIIGADETGGDRRRVSGSSD